MSSVLKPLLLQSFRTGGLYLLIIALSLAISATTALKFSNTLAQLLAVHRYHSACAFHQLRHKPCHSK